MLKLFNKKQKQPNKFDFNAKIVSTKINDEDQLECHYLIESKYLKVKETRYFYYNKSELEEKTQQEIKELIRSDLNRLSSEQYRKLLHIKIERESKNKIKTASYAVIGMTANKEDIAVEEL